MEKYIGTTFVMAKPMSLRDYNTYIGLQSPKNENPDDEGFLVRHSDGRENWIPKLVFNRSHHAFDGCMDFGNALNLLKMGFKMKRKGWNGKNQYIELAIGISYVNGDNEIVNCEHRAIKNKAIAFVGTSGVQIGWLATQSDMLAEDWIVA